MKALYAPSALLYCSSYINKHRSHVCHSPDRDATLSARWTRQFETMLDVSCFLWKCFHYHFLFLPPSYKLLLTESILLSSAPSCERSELRRWFITILVAWKDKSDSAILEQHKICMQYNPIKIAQYFDIISTHCLTPGGSDICVRHLRLRPTDGTLAQWNKDKCSCRL